MDLNVVWGAIFRTAVCLVCVLVLAWAYVLGWYAAHHHSSRESQDEFTNKEEPDNEDTTG